MRRQFTPGAIRCSRLERRKRPLTNFRTAGLFVNTIDLGEKELKRIGDEVAGGALGVRTRPEHPKWPAGIKIKREMNLYPVPASALSVACAVPGAITRPRKILIIEDERDIADLIALHLSDLPAQITAANDGLRGLQLATREPWDAIVLDIRLPGMNGLDLCLELRARLLQVPILMLTARSGELDRVLGLELGADDYLTKPFSVLELQARMKALLRRSALTAAKAAQASAEKPSSIDHGELRVDRLQRRAWLEGVEVTLAPREFDLLWHFVQHPGRVYTRTELLADVWGHGHDGYDHTVNSHINRLRSKLGDERAEAAFIHTVWGVGYRFELAA